MPAMPHPIKWSRPATPEARAAWKCQRCGATFPTDDAGTAAARDHASACAAAGSLPVDISHEDGIRYSITVRVF